MNNSFPESITKDEIKELPLLKYQGAIHVIDSKDKLTVALNHLSKATVLGFDTEKKPTFKKGQHHPTALVQLSTGDEAFLFRINTLGIPDGLIEIFESENIVITGVGIRDDLIDLNDIIQFTPRGFEDLNEITPKLGVKNVGIRNLAAIFLQKRVSKNQQTSNWENGRLTEGQQHYAAADAWICYEIRRVLVENGCHS